MSATFDIFPEADEAETMQSAVVVSSSPAAAPRGIKALKAAVIDEFAQTEPVLRTLVARYDNVALDVTTPKGMKAAKEARHDMREHGRYVVQRATEELKGEVNALKPLIEAEAERLVAIVKPTEDRYDEAIKAQEAIDKAAKAERDRIEAERVAKHRANLAQISGVLTVAQGKTSAQILTIINGVSGIDIIPEQWEEFAVGAEMQKAETLEALQALFDITKRTEEEASAREAQRIENERIAAELAEKERMLAERQAEIDRKLAAIAAAEKAEADRAQAEEDALVSSIRSPRIEGDTVGYIQKAMVSFEVVAPHWEDDPRERVRRAASETRAYLAGRLQAAHTAAAISRQDAEDEANRRAQEAASEIIDELSDDALTAMPAIADEVPPVEPPAAAREEQHIRLAVSVGVHHPAPEPLDMDEVERTPWVLPSGPVEFAGEEPESGLDNARGLADVIALLSHLDEAFMGKFASHPKPAAAWWGRLRQLADETRTSVLA